MELSHQIKDSAVGMATVAMAIIAHFDQYTVANNVLPWHFLWPPYIIGQAIYIFILSFVILLSFFSFLA